MNNLKKVLSLAVVVLAFVFVLGGTSKAEAAAIASNASGDWNTGATWVGGVVPGVGDTVTIASGHVITMTASPVAASVASLTINNAGATTGLTMSGASTALNVTGALTLALPSGDGTTTVAVGDASLTVDSISMTGGAANRIVKVTVSTGTLTVDNGNIAFAGTDAQEQLTVTGAGNVVMSGATGAINTTGTVSLATDSTVTFSGSGAQTVNAYGYYNLALAGTGVKTIAATTTITYDLTIDATLEATPVVLTNGTASTVGGGLKIGGTWKSAGSWGSSGSAATNQNAYFAAANTGTITSSMSHTGGSTTYTDPVVAESTSSGSTTTTPEVTEETPATPATNEIPGCGTRTTGFSSTTGASCVGNTATTTTETPATTTYNFGTTLVKLGSKGEACKAWQSFFNAHGSTLVVDGWCGKMTIAAAKAWQTSVGLTADGKLGAMSRAKASM